MRKSRFSIVALVLVAMLALSGLVAAQDTVALNLSAWGGSDQENQALQARIDAFNDANPNIVATLNILPGDYTTAMQTAFASGEYPDAFYVDSSRFFSWVESGVLDDGTTKIDAPDGLYPSLGAGFTYQGDLYCPPKDFSTLGLEYNVDMFDAAGVAYPTADWTWADLRSAAEALTTTDANGDLVIGLVLPADLNRWLPFLFQAGGTLFDESGNPTLNTDAANEAIEFYTGLVTDGFASPASTVDSGWGGEALGKGRAAMVMEGNWVINVMNEQYPDINWGVSELPQGPAGQATMAYTVCYAVGAATQHPDEAWALVNFLTNDDGAQYVAEQSFGPMPTRSGAADAWLEHFGASMQPFVTGAEYAHVWQLPAGYLELEGSFNSALQQAFAGQILPEDVLTQTQDVATQIQARGGAEATAAP